MAATLRITVARAAAREQSTAGTSSDEIWPER
jgi:hypothetical protein